MLSLAIERARRRVDEAIYLLPSGAGNIDTNGSTVTNVNNSGVVSTPQIWHRMIGGGIGAAFANDSEHFNQDVWGAFNDISDHFFFYPSYCSAYMAYLLTLAGNPTLAGSYMGLSLGEVTTFPANVPGTGHTAFAIARNLNTAHWETWVIDQFGPAGGKLFVTDLGDRPNGIAAWPSTYFLEIDYYPGSRVDFYINRGNKSNGGLVQRWTDQGNGGAFTPLANTLAHETSSGLTIGGCTEFVIIADPNIDAAIYFEFRTRRTRR